LINFENSVKPGGILIYDSNGITRHPVRKDISVYCVDAASEQRGWPQQKLLT